ncbi:MAG: class I SAM-dependent methyltransferase [Ignavibacteriae bacterium]|nr:class I SAM-dependent methyltransferase [Ignavibacteriota bacterium]MCB9244039.1 class I SAM-dependent methyltransferase [Ignavibacteriales bacterium]
MGSFVTEDNKVYTLIIKHYEDCLEKFGDSHLGVDWPNEKDAETRYRVMVEVIRDPGEKVSLLDFGCGAAHLYEYISNFGLTGIEYSGLDISRKFIELCRKKFPSLNFLEVDILENPENVPEFDYIVMNGVFTEKRELSYNDMLDYFKKLIRAVFEKAKKGIAFNVMSKHVDWEREDLFHLSFDELGSFLKEEISRNFTIRNDYGLYEYTVYIYK